MLSYKDAILLQVYKDAFYERSPLKLQAKSLKNILEKVHFLLLMIYLSVFVVVVVVVVVVFPLLSASKGLNYSFAPNKRPKGLNQRSTKAVIL